MALLPNLKKLSVNICVLANILLLLTTVSVAEAKFKCHSKIDMAFLLDSSGSITRQQFEIAKKFAADLVKHFDISKEKTNVAVATYSQYARTTRTFENHASQKLVLKAIRGLSYEGAASRLDLGFDLVRSTLFDTQKGARPTNKAVKRVAVFITDGYSTRGVEFTRDNAATLTRTKGVKLFSVGISDRIDKAELDALASKPYNTHQLVIQTPGNPFNKYQVQRFAKQICRCE